MKRAAGINLRLFSFWRVQNNYQLNSNTRFFSQKSN
jgi:hypothetical protein